MRSRLLALTLLLSGCSCGDDDGGGGPSPDAGGSDAGADAGDAAPDAAADAGPSGIGSPCTSGGGDLQGTCADGQLCAPMPDGYCSAECGGGADCPLDALCAESFRIGELCMFACDSDDDCRFDAGYFCDPDWHVCTQPNLLSPVPPTCAGEPALARNVFGPATPISSPAGASDFDMEPAAAFDADGDLTAVFRTAHDGVGAPSGIGVSTIAPDGSLDGDRALETGTEHAYDMWMKADRDGTLHVVWLGMDGLGGGETNHRIGYASSDDGFTWSAARAIHAPEDCPADDRDCLDKPMIAVGPAVGDPDTDAIYALYFSEPQGSMRLVRSLDGGATFPAPSVEVGEGVYGDAEIDAAGTIHVTFTHPNAPGVDPFGDARRHVRYTSSTDGGLTFSASLPVSSEPVPFYFSNPQVVADADRGLLYIVYPAGQTM